MNAIGLNIIVEGNCPMPLFLPEHEAQTIQARFSDGRWSEGEVVGGFTVDGVRWACRWDKICAMHTFNPQAQQQRSNTGNSLHYRSGN